MNFIHRMKTLPRLVDDALAARLRVMPAVVLTGARRTGKSTLVEHLVPDERLYRAHGRVAHHPTGVPCPGGGCCEAAVPGRRSAEWRV
jgi:hypothetical protein